MTRSIGSTRPIPWPLAWKQPWQVCRDGACHDERGAEFGLAKGDSGIVLLSRNSEANNLEPRTKQPVTKIAGNENYYRRKPEQSICCSHTGLRF